jgi:hypothetical protein
VGLLCTAGMLSGIFGEARCDMSHTDQSLELVDKSEEEEDGATVICEKERFSNELTLVFCNGENRHFEIVGSKEMRRVFWPCRPVSSKG